MLTWLLEKDIFENLDELKTEIKNQGMDYIIGKCIPFGSFEFEHYEYDYGFAYGSLQFCKRIKEEQNHINGPFLPPTTVFCDLNKFSCSYYYPRLSKYLLNQDHTFLPYGELIDKEEWVFDTFGVDDCVFMRPNSGFKEFTGQVYEKKYWKGMIELSNTNIQPEDLVVISSPKNIDAEYRVVIGPDRYKKILCNIDASIITLSGSHINGKLEPRVEEDCSIAPYIREFINGLLSETLYEPDPFYIIDIASTENGLSVLEVNSMSCSGYYKCDLSKIVGAIKEYFK